MINQLNSLYDSLSATHRMLMSNWLSNWNEWFVDYSSGGFHERLDVNTKPIHLGYKRLVTQCRQIYVNAYAHLLTKEDDLLAVARHGFSYITNYYKADYGWYFSIGDNNTPYDKTRDLYAHAFVILCLSKYYQATNDTTALILAKDTLNLIKRFFYAPSGGYYEALDDALNPIPKMRRQNPHMHLLEACMSMYEVSLDIEYLSVADYIITLFKQYFFDVKKQILGEFYTDELLPDNEYGHIIEPGHHFEWVWLLHKRLTLSPVNKDHKYCVLSLRALFNLASIHGVDHVLGGVFNEIGKNLNVINSDKRIWALTESIRAHSILAIYYEDNKQIDMAVKLLDIFNSFYLQKSGRWTEVCKQDYSAKIDYMPGTTTYHIFINIIETYYMFAKEKLPFDQSVTSL